MVLALFISKTSAGIRSAVMVPKLQGRLIAQEAKRGATKMMPSMRAHPYGTTQASHPLYFGKVTNAGRLYTYNQLPEPDTTVKHLQ